jgi:hypothetical protein
LICTYLNHINFNARDETMKRRLVNTSIDVDSNWKIGALLGAKRSREWYGGEEE